MASEPSPSTVAVVGDAQARHLVQTSLYDRVAVVPDRLEFALIPASVSAQIRATDGSFRGKDTGRCIDDAEADTTFVTVDDSLVYARFFADFGPLDLGQTVRFCRDLANRIAAASTRVVLVSSDHAHKRANVMVLLALFLVVVHKRLPLEAVAPFRSLRPAQGFRDAACGVCSFLLTVYDCARAVHKAMRSSIFCYESFSLDQYEYYDKLHHGDMNWIVPGKLLAFSGPQRECVVLDESGRTTLLAHEYAKVFRALGVSCVVRFNEPTTYDRKAFVQANIRHLDMHYPDGGNPTDEILLKFIRTCERETGAVAVHCKAGLGRTGTNIAAYLIKKHGFSAVEAIAWCRICRPGSIVGPQQQYLVVKEPQLRALAAAEDGDQQRQYAKAVESHPQPIPMKKQSFAAMQGRLPPASNVTMPPTKRVPFRRGKRSDVGPTGTAIVEANHTAMPPMGR